MTARHVKLLAALRKIDAAILGNTPYSVDQSLYASCIKAIENYAAECESLRSRLAEAEAALASATVDTWWAKAYFKKHPRTPDSATHRENEHE